MAKFGPLRIGKIGPLRIGKNRTPPGWQKKDPSGLAKTGPFGLANLGHFQIDKHRTLPDWDFSGFVKIVFPGLLKISPYTLQDTFSDAIML